jgi:hypothetical protein
MRVRDGRMRSTRAKFVADMMAYSLIRMVESKSDSHTMTISSG